MRLTDVEVDKQQLYSVKVGGYFGDRRVVYEIPREALDDYFHGRPHLTDTQRHTLVTSNLESISAVMQQKCEQQAWHSADRGVGQFWLLHFGAGDLKLNDHQLAADEKAQQEARE